MSLALILLLLLQVFAFASGSQNSQEVACAAQRTCTDCLRTKTCVWCAAVSTDKAPLVRCVTRKKYQTEKDRWCRNSDAVAYESNAVIVDSLPLLSTKTANPVQVEPQAMKLQLRRGEKYTVTLKYSQAEDYPVDLYYLMDLSSSMELHKNRLSKLGVDLAKAMKNLTSNFRLGFGSFVDKVVLPMTSTLPKKLVSPCALKSGKPCAPPYGYIHQMSLSDDVDLFKTSVQEAPVSGNLDAPEGGLDAMMQAIVCTDKIGWRSKARRLLVFSTDAAFHVAGDGRLAGIVEPNDGLCHLDENGIYTHSLLLDYPSISQIKRKARDHNVNIIFAVTKGKNSIYQLLSRSISGTSVGLLDDTSKNVVELVSGHYKKLVNMVELTDNAPNFINVRYFSECKDGELLERRECVGHRVHDIVEFNIDIEAVECPKDPKDWLQTIQIKPHGVNESLTIDLKLLCACSCDTPEHVGYKLNATECKGNGNLACGLCSCHEGFHGKHCECKGNEASEKSDELKEDCKRGNETVPCSGHGVCHCGECNCAKRPDPRELFYGKYCECDNFSCKRHEGSVCGGNGECECGTCNCLPGWGGETCNCQETNTTCIPSEGNSEICSGHGKCDCGSCKCDEIDGIRYSGVFCEDCPTCPGQHCEELKECVEYLAYQTGPSDKNTTDYCSHQIQAMFKIDKVEVTAEDESSNARVCKIPTDSGCSFVFKYIKMRGDIGKNKKEFNIWVENEKDCPAKVNVLGVAIGVIVSTVILGFVILLIWKLIMEAHDKREFAKFENERLMAKWDRGDNPLYKQATSTFKNPTFAETSTKR